MLLCVKNKFFIILKQEIHRQNDSDLQEKYSTCNKMKSSKTKNKYKKYGGAWKKKAFEVHSSSLY